MEDVNTIGIIILAVVFVAAIVALPRLQPVVRVLVPVAVVAAAATATAATTTSPSPLLPFLLLFCIQGVEVCI